MKIKLSYKHRDSIPAGHEHLYTEVNGRHVLTQVDGLDGLARAAASTRDRFQDFLPGVK